MASYIIHMVGGVILENVEDTTMFQMLEKMQVECVCKGETGEVVYTLSLIHISEPTRPY